ncbi:SIR2-like domain-containing protein [Pseudoduganella namucuonensis]|uniref:SIR2-like domain-containing protein n=2 Tax=Pseudoduganella namucuonensis TaxID=1035707 RepID=A0A1I7GNR9_9BURK|nr:SIR2-like domain-containing protein [Pseudoduganella namucuonensis]
MPRKLIIFSNGLGMALDPAHFSLNTALAEIWNREYFLTNEHKRLIERCIGRPGAPVGEHELDQLHRAVTYCKALNQIGAGQAHWLTADGQNFPEITAQYIHKVATKLHNYDGVLPPDFEGPLLDFVKDTKSHVATLNYDKLLYTSFIANDVFGGYYNACLVDGMVATGFSASALERRYGNNFGYYLHLHGSPLFVNRGQQVVKLARDDLTLEVNEASEHIVLTHVEHKPSVIAASLVLSTYWDYLRVALSEVDEVILFGYSGLDDHLNVLLRPYLSATQIRVVEWEGAGDQAGREAYWREKLGRPVNEVVRLGNVATFTDW